MFHSSIQESIIRIDDIIRDIHALNNGNETDKQHVSGGTSVSLTVVGIFILDNILSTNLLYSDNFIVLLFF